MTFDFSLLFSSLPQILAGVGLTLQLLALSLLIGTLAAVPVALARMSRRPWLLWPAYGYVFVLRGTPLLAQLFVVYYGLPQLPGIRDGVLWPLLRDPYWCAVIALTLNHCAYTAEIFRAGMQGVDRGLHEAGWALGLSRRQRFLHVTVPLALRLSLPAFGNETISLLKATALASTVTLMEITGVARTIVARTLAPYEIFLAAALVYLSMTWVIERGIALAERRMSRHVRR